MEKLMVCTDTYSIYESDNNCAKEVAEFIVKENYAHHLSQCIIDQTINKEISNVYDEEQMRTNSLFYLARTHQGKLIGSIRVFKWNMKDILPIEQIFRINPLKIIGEGEEYSYWHIGRLAIRQDAVFSTITLFKDLMAFAIHPIVHDEHGYMIAETDCRLLRVMNMLGIRTTTIGEPINHLASMTVPIYASRNDLVPYYNKVMHQHQKDVIVFSHTKV